MRAVTRRADDATRALDLNDVARRRRVPVRPGRGRVRRARDRRPGRGRRRGGGARRDRPRRRDGLRRRAQRRRPGRPRVGAVRPGRRRRGGGSRSRRRQGRRRLVLGHQHRRRRRGTGTAVCAAGDRRRLHDRAGHARRAVPRRRHGGTRCGTRRTDRQGGDRPRDPCGRRAPDRPPRCAAPSARRRSARATASPSTASSAPRQSCWWASTGAPSRRTRWPAPRRVPAIPSATTRSPPTSSPAPRTRWSTAP